MRILLIAATSFEIQPTIDFLAGQSVPGTDVLVTGIGALPAAWTLMHQVTKCRPDLVIQAGIAGSFIPADIGSVYVIKEEILADLGVVEQGQFRSIFDLKLASPDSPPFINGRLVNPHHDLLHRTALPPARAITINEITTSPERIAWYQQNHAPVVESMEGAALHYVCLRENIPFLQLRSVSNEVGQRDKTRWDFKASIKNLNDHLARIIKTI